MFKIEFEVRDSELDVQGIVNNANYLVYLEHARHKYLHSIGLDFVNMAKNKQNLVLVKLELEYKKSLTANDKFYVLSHLASGSGVRFFLKQEIRRTHDEQLILKATNSITCIDELTRKLYIPQMIKNLI